MYVMILVKLYSLIGPSVITILSFSESRNSLTTYRAALAGAERKGVLQLNPDKLTRGIRGIHHDSINSPSKIHSIIAGLR